MFTFIGRRLISVLHLKTPTVHTGASVIAVATALSLIFSIVRDRALAHIVGPGALLDAFYISFKIPDLFFVLVTMFTSVFAFLPFFEEQILKGKKIFQQSVQTSLYFLSIVLVLLGGFLFVFTPSLIHFFYPNIPITSLDQVVFFTRMFTLQAFLLGISNFLSTLIQMQKRFLLFALTPVVYTGGMIVGVVWLYPWLGASGLGLGVVGGALIHLLIQYPAIRAYKLSLIPEFHPQFVLPVLLTIARSIPRSLALSSSQVVQFVSSIYIAPVAVGAFSIYTLADNIRTVPLALIGVAYSVASFPVLAEYVVKKQHTELRKTIEQTISMILFLTIPIVVGLIVFREEIIYVLLTSGLFTIEAARTTMVAVASLSVGTVGISILYIGSRVFYAGKNTLIPFVILVSLSVFKIVALSVVANTFATSALPKTIVNLFFDIKNKTALFLTEMGILFSLIELLAGVVMIFALWYYFKISIKRVVISFAQHVWASALAYLAMNYIADLFSFPPSSIFLNLLVLVGGGVVGIIVWSSILYMMKNKEFLLAYEYLIEKINYARTS
ncbi:MAG: lipid II flippase MurJ [Alphaproteobacteria bacterium]|nr:lipid II flippase MurJ [Alphaproteobacteria bacterium]